LNFLGGLARLATVLVETDDFMYQLQFIVGVALNGVIVLQFALYWNNVTAVGDNKVENAKPTSDASPSKKTRREKVE